jgi:hypothetical protein
MKTFLEKRHQQLLLTDLDTMCDRFVNGDLSNSSYKYTVKTISYTFLNILKKLEKFQYTSFDKKTIIKEGLETLEFYGLDKDEVWVLV